MDNLEFIRDTIERSTEFTAVPGYGGVLMGATALGAATVASFQPNYRLWLVTWLADAALAFSIGLLAMWQKSKSVETTLTSIPAKKFARGFAPPLVTGVILTGLLFFNGYIEHLPVVWLTLYGTAVVTGGAYSVRAVPLMGWIFILLGGIAVVLPTAYGNLLMALGFGVMHIIFGIVIGRKYGG